MFPGTNKEREGQVSSEWCHDMNNPLTRVKDPLFRDAKNVASTASTIVHEAIMSFADFILSIAASIMVFLSGWVRTRSARRMTDPESGGRKKSEQCPSFRCGSVGLRAAAITVAL